MIYVDNNTNIEYDHIDNSILPIGSKIGAAKYQEDENGFITSSLPIINAVDIDWNNACVCDEIRFLNTTSDVLSVFKMLLDNYKNLYNELSDDEITIAAATDKLDEIESSIDELLVKVNRNESKLNALISYLNINEEDLNNN